MPSGTPVSPAMKTPPLNHADEGEAEKRFPRASATFTVVVSGDGPGGVASGPVTRPTTRCRRRSACPWLELPGIAGAGAVARRERVDEGSALGGVGVGQETADGDLRELRVAIEVIPVCERQLERLRDGVDVLRGVVAHPLEIEAPQERERLEEDRPLTPEPGLEDLEGAMSSREAAARGSFHATTVARQVRFGQDAAGLLNGPGDALGDVTAIEAIARRVDRLLASAVQVLLLHLDERPEGAGEIRLAEHAPVRWDRHVGALQIHAGPAREHVHALHLGGEKAAQELVPRKPIGEGDCGLEHLTE